jgi:phosphoglycolate phosphatase-like HAD superfamily hydrolase
MELLILFDLDGTLTRTQNGYAPFNEAILETFGHGRRYPIGDSRR